MDKSLIRALNRRFDQKVNELSQRPAQLGDGNGNLYPPNQPGYVYCIVGGAVEVVRCKRISPSLGLNVLVGRPYDEPKVYQVIGEISTSSGSSLTTNPGPAPSKRYEWMAEGGGQDPLAIHLRAFTFLGIYTTKPASMNVKLIGGRLWNGATWLTISQQVIDLSSYVPATSGKALFALITIDTDGDIVITPGSEVDLSALDEADKPDIPVDTLWACAAVRLYEGQTAIYEHRLNPDIVDLRLSVSGGDSVDSVNGQTGDVVLDPDDLDDSATTHKFTTAAEISKLAGIEAGADVTDIANVGSALNGASADTPLDADTFHFWDAVDSILKKITWANVKSTLQGLFTSSTAVITDNAVVRGDGGSRGLQESILFISDNGTISGRLTNFLESDTERESGQLTKQMTVHGNTPSTHAPQFLGQRGRGTFASPSAVQSGDLGFRVSVKGHNGSSFPTATGTFDFFFTETHVNGTNGGTAFRVLVTPNASVTAAQLLTLLGSGHLIMGTGAAGPSGGGAPVFVMPDAGNNPTGMPTNTAGLFAKDVSGTTELFAVDEAGSVTQLSPHAKDAPSWLYDETPGKEEVHRSENIYRGEITWSNETRKNKLLQSLIDLTPLPLDPNKKKISVTETYDQYNQRTGATLQKLDWNTVHEEIRQQRDLEIQKWDAANQEKNQLLAQIEQHIADVELNETDEEIKATKLKLAYQMIEELNNDATPRPQEYVVKPIPDQLKTIK